MRVVKGWLAAAALVATWGAATDASASGFSVARFGGEQGHPMTSNGTSLYYNPGGFAAAEGHHVFIDGSLAWRSASYKHTPSEDDCFTRSAGDPDDGGCSLPQPGIAEEANTDEGTLFNIIGAPTAFATFDLGDFGLALGFFTPFGGQAKWDKESSLEGTEYQGIGDGGQRWYTIDGILRTSYLSAGVGYDFSELGLSVGFAVNALVSTVETIRARVAGVSNDDITKEGRSRLLVNGFDWSIGLGARFEATENTVVGISWQSAPNINGNMELDGTLTNIYGPGDVPEGSESDVTLHQSLPQVFRAGVESKVSDSIALRFFGDWQTWSNMENQCVTERDEECDVTKQGTDKDGEGIIVNQPRNWEDTFGLRFGLSYFVSDSVELTTGIGFASNAVPDDTLEPALMDFDALTPVVGGRFALSDSIHLAAAYTQVYYFSRDTSGKSTHFQKPFPSQGPDAGGKYSQSIGVLNVNADFAF